MNAPGLRFELSAELESFLRSMQRADTAVDRHVASMNRSGAQFAQRMERGTGRAARGFSNMGGQMQNVGYQVGDFATQVASGGNVLVAFTQQATQVAGAFGPWGAVIGAAGAVVGALATYLLSAGDAAETAEDRTRALDDAISGIRGAAITGGEGIANLIERYGALDAQLITLIQRQTQLNVLMAQSDLRKSLGGLTEDLPTTSLTLDPNAPRSRAQEGRLASFAKDMGITVDKARELQGVFFDLSQAETVERQVEAAGRLSDALGAAVPTTATEAYVEFAHGIGEVVSKVREFEQAQREAGKAGELLAKPIPELTRLADEAGAGGGGGGRSRSRSGGGSRPDPDRVREEAERVAEQIRDRTEALRMEADMIGLGAEARARLTAEMEAERLRRALLKKAAEEGVAVDAQTLETIDALTAEYANAAAALEQMRAAQEAAAQAKRDDAKAAEEAKRSVEQMANSITGAIQQAESFEDALKNVAIQLANIAIQGLGGSGPLGGALGGFIPGLFGGDVRAPSAGMGPARLFAKGGVVNAPTAFPMGGGELGLMGEAGPEGILPLARNARGELGVKTAGAGGQSVVELRLSRDLEARILREAAGNSVKIATRAVATGSPAIVADMRRRDMIR